MKKKDKNKGITIDKLAGMVQRGFAAAEKGAREFRNEVNERFKKIDEKFNETWLKLESLERRIIYLEDKITEHLKELKEIKVMIQKYQ